MGKVGDAMVVEMPSDMKIGGGEVTAYKNKSAVGGAGLGREGGNGA